MTSEYGSCNGKDMHDVRGFFIGSCQQHCEEKKIGIVKCIGVTGLHIGRMSYIRTFIPL
jgi:hypothetical protein